MTQTSVRDAEVARFGTPSGATSGPAAIDPARASHRDGALQDAQSLLRAAREPRALASPNGPSPRSLERDAPALGPTLDRLAAFLADPGTRTPVTVGILGTAGSGKSVALTQLLERLRAGLGSRPGSPHIYLQRMDAATLEGGIGDLATALAAALHAGLRQAYPALAGSLAQSARDPHVAARELDEKLDDARRRLDAERHALDEVGSRRARLTESVLFDASGSQVDAFARANHSAIAGRMAAFGVAGEPNHAFKTFVHYAAAPGGQAALMRRALWGFDGQGRLLATAVVLVGLGLGLGLAYDTRDGWLEQLRAGSQAGAAAGFAAQSWLAAHVGWLLLGRFLAYAGAVLAIAANLWRASAFVGPIRKGVRLLAGDLDGRRHDLDGLLAHQTKRVTVLSADVERLGRASAQAETQAGGFPHEPSPFAVPAVAQARGFFGELGAALAGEVPASLTPASQSPANEALANERPQRIVLALDNLDVLPPERARALLDAVNSIACPGLIVVVAGDPARLDPGRDGTLERWIALPVHLGIAADRDAAGAFAGGLLGLASQTPAGRVPASTPDPAIAPGEAAMLVAVAPLAGTTPRAVRQFLLGYRLARGTGEAPRGALALMLALERGGTAAEQEMVDKVSDAAELPPTAPPRLRDALAAARALDGHVGEAAIRIAARQAARFAFRS